MAVFDDNNDGWQKYLADAIGRHVAQGNLLAHVEEFVGSQGEKQFALDLALANGAAEDADGEGAWDGPEKVYYKGRELTEGVDWYFSPGTLSAGTEDPGQGESPLFPGGGVYSGTVRLTVKLPAGSDDFDPSGLKVIARCAKLGRYDEDGERIGVEYSVNPADVKAFLLKRAGKLARVWWARYATARAYNAATLAAPAGGEDSYEDFTGPTTFDLFGPGASEPDGGLSKSAGDGYNFYAVSKESIPADTDGSFEFTIGGAFPVGTGGGEAHLVDESGTPLFGVSWGNGHLAVLANQVPFDDITAPFDYPAAAGDTVKLESGGGFFKLYKNGVLQAIPQGAAVVPSQRLRAKVTLWESSASVFSSTFTGKRVTETAVATVEVSRWEAHPAFTAPTDLQTALDFVDGLTAGETRFNRARIEFLTQERASSFTLDDRTNVDAKSVRLYEKPADERPTQLWAEFRDTLSATLTVKPASDVDEDLHEELGRHTRIGPLNFASMPTSQAQRLVAFEGARRRIKDYCQLTGLAGTYRVLVGDVVTLLTRKLDYVPTDYLVLKATREPQTGKRRLTLRRWSAAEYSDVAHALPQSQGTTATVSSLTPPGAPVLRLSQVTSAGVGGAVTTKVRGTVYFPVSSSQLVARIFVTRPEGGVAGTVETDAGVGTLSPPAGSNQKTFEYPADVAGPYTFRAQIETAAGVPGGSTSQEIVVGDAEQEIDEPQNFAADVSLPEQVTLSWDEPAAHPERVTAYEVLADNEVTVVMPRQLVRTFTVQGVAAGTYTWKLRAWDSMGNHSGLVPVTFTVAAAASASLTVEESDGAPTESPVTKIVVPKNWVSEPAAGQVRLKPLHLLVFEFDGFGSVLTAAIDEAQIDELPWDCKVLKWRLVEASSVPIAATATVDLRKDSYANYPPDAADSITGTGTKPNLAGPQTKNEGSNFTDWATTQFTKGDVPRAVLTAVTLAKKLRLVLTVEEL